MMVHDWNHCPLMIEYDKTKRAYLKELRLEKWKEGQRAELWNAIQITFGSIDEPKKEYWMERLYSYYCRRFQRLTACEWLVFLGELKDTAAYGDYIHEKARNYCCRIRDTAYWMTHGMKSAVETACEPVWRFEYERVAA